MNIALIGYGKMGKTIERLAIAQGHTVVACIDAQNLQDFERLGERADVAIEFSQPEAVFGNLLRCFEEKLPVVCGTTGWLDQLEAAKEACLAHESAFFYASNYSIGVNIFFEMNRQLANFMSTQSGYNVSMKEIHHTQKLDAPSGTALSLANDILERIERKKTWMEQPFMAPPATVSPEHLLIETERRDPEPGTHIVRYNSPTDSIEIQHVAHSREGFAQGALQAANWVIGKKGNFTMKDMLGF
jgi:4-hydroxy-tetrahydrodipicolinate reductase